MTTVQTSVTDSATKPQKGQRILYFSVLNVVACIGVILLHCNGVFWSHPTGRTWVTANLIETLFYFPVPIFFMLSGATLMEYSQRYSTKVFMKKRVVKTVIPFLIWSAIAAVYCFVRTPEAYTWGPRSIIMNIFQTNFMPVYWFFLPLFGIYLAMPILTKVQDKLKTFCYAIMIGLIFVAILPLMCQLVGIEYNGALTPPPVLGYMIFVFLGYVLSKTDLTKKQRYVIYAAGVIGWALQFFGTLWLTTPGGEISMVFKGYNNLPSVLQSVAVFVFFKHLSYDGIKRRLPWFEKAVTVIAGLTFGIYLIHEYLIWLLPGWFGWDAGSIIFRTLGAGLIFVLAAGLTYVIKKIPGLRKIVP